MLRESESVPEELPRRYVASRLHDGKKVMANPLYTLLPAASDR